jgi:hypothetical protein
MAKASINDPKHWRERAQQARALADKLPDAKAKRRMLKLVGDYQELAIGSIRRECVDHVVALGEQHLREVVKSYASYYNAVRTYRSLAKDAPLTRPVQRIGRIASQPWSVVCITNTSESEFSVHTTTKHSLWIVGIRLLTIALTVKSERHYAPTSRRKIPQDRSRISLAEWCG